MSNVVAPEANASIEIDTKKVAKAVVKSVKIAADIAEASGVELPDDLDLGGVPVGGIAKIFCCLCKKVKKHQKKKEKGLQHDVTKAATKLAVAGLKEALD